MMEFQKIKNFFASFLELVFLLFIILLIRSCVFGLYQVPSGSMETTMLVGERFFGDKLTYLFRAPKPGEIIAFNEPRFPYSKNKLIELYQRYIGFPISEKLPLSWRGPSNWTKRIIGEPGDTLHGVIEDDKPVIYLTNEKKGIVNQKLDEPYLNKYPLIEFVPELQCHPRSYDPNKPFEDQPFYRMSPSSVYLDYEGKPKLTYPTQALHSEQRNVQERIAQRMKNAPNTKGYIITASDEFYVTLGDNQYWVMGDNRRGSQDSRWFGPIDRKEIHGRILFRIWSIDSAESWWILDLIKHPIDFWKRIRWGRFFQFIK